MSLETDTPILLEDFIADPAPFFSIESTVGSTHPLTTVAGQKVLVTAKGDFTGTSGNIFIYLKYNGVTKDTVQIRGGSLDYTPFCLQYVEVPGVGTEDITVESSSGGLGRVVITVQKLLIA